MPTPGRKPLRYTLESAVNGGSRFKSPTDNQPGRSFRDPQGKIHVVPNKALRRVGKKAKAERKGKSLDLRSK